MPILLTILNPEKVYTIEIIRKISEFINFSDEKYFILFLLLGSAFLILFLAVFRSFNMYLGIKIAADTLLYLSNEAFQRVMYEKYYFHKNTPANNLSSAIITKCSEISVMALQLANLVNGLIIIFFISIFMLIVNYQITLICYFVFFFIYYIFIKKYKYKVFINSKNISKRTSELYKIVGEMIGNIKNIILDKNYFYYSKNFYNTNLEYMNAAKYNKFITYLPKIIIESFVFLLIILIVIFIFLLDKNTSKHITFLVFFSLCFQRILPLLNQIYVSYSSTASLRGSYEDVFKLINKKINKKIYKKKLNFNNKIEFINVGFKYSENNKNVLTNVNITIYKNDKIGIIGSSGSGKSTFLDLLMGFLIPTEGKILIDNYNLEKNINLWHNNISYSSQNVFIQDCSLDKNISNKANYSEKKLINSLKKAQINDLIQLQKKEIYENTLGEQGKRLSSGQIQRLGIARVFFKDKEVVILDEATNALDSASEKLILNEFYSLKNKTLIICSHKYENLKQCNKIYKIKNGKLYEYNKKNF